jgi:hypothetical protein
MSCTCILFYEYIHIFEEYIVYKLIAALQRFRHLLHDVISRAPIALQTHSLAISSDNRTRDVFRPSSSTISPLDVKRCNI